MFQKMRRSVGKIFFSLMMLAILVPNFTVFANQVPVTQNASVAQKDGINLKYKPDTLWKVWSQDAPSWMLESTPTAILAPMSVLTGAQVSPENIGVNTTVTLTATTSSSGADMAWVTASIPVLDVEISLEDQGDGKWTGTWVTPSSGNYKGIVAVVFEARDQATPPNNSQHIVNAYLDLVPPWLSVRRPLNGNAQTDPILIVSGYSEADSTIVITSTVQSAPNSTPITYTDLVTDTAGGSWQTELDYGDGFYALQVQAIDRVGNRSQPTDSIEVTVDSTPPLIGPVTAEPQFVSPFVNNCGDMACVYVNATVSDAVSGVDWVKGTFSDFGDNEYVFTPLGNALYQFKIQITNTGDGFKGTQITAADQYGNTSVYTDDQLYIVDSAPPEVVWENFGISDYYNLIIQGNRLYYAANSTGKLNMTVAVSDTHEITVTSGLDMLTFPSIFGGDGVVVDYTGHLSDTVTHAYMIDNSDEVAATKTVRATDRAGNEGTAAFVVLKDTAGPNQLTLSLLNANNAYLTGSTLYYGPLTSGQLKISVKDPTIAGYPGCGVASTTFPALFGQPEVMVTDSNPDREYTIAVDQAQSGTFTVQSTDKLGNEGNSSFTVTWDDLAPNVSITVTKIENGVFNLTWDAQDELSGLSNKYNVEYKIGGLSNDWVSLMENTTRTSAVFDKLAPGQWVSFRVSASDNVGNVGSAEVGPFLEFFTTFLPYINKRSDS